MPATSKHAFAALAAIAGSVILSGCASSAQDGRAGLDDRFGQVTSHNMQAQFVPPTEAQKANTYIQPNPARQRLAIETYEAGEVELETVVTE